MSTEVYFEVRDGQTFLAGLPMFSGDHGELEQAFESMVASESQHLVVTANVDQVLDLKSSKSLLDAYQNASLRLIDGMPIVSLFRLLGLKKPYRHTGADLLQHAARWSQDNGWHIVIVGGAADTGERAAKHLAEQYVGSKISHVDFPMVSDVTSSLCSLVVEELIAMRPDLVFVCLGSPKQEIWASYWNEVLPPAIYVGAGAAVDFAAGVKSRAPRVVQDLGFEWLWRLAQEPSRLAKRYLIKGPAFFFIITESLRRTRL